MTILLCNAKSLSKRLLTEHLIIRSGCSESVKPITLMSLVHNMVNEYHNLRVQSNEIFELIDCKYYDDAKNKINNLIPKFLNHTTYISELQRILEAMKKGVQPRDYLDSRRNEFFLKTENRPRAREIPKQISDALLNFEMYIRKPQTEFK